MPYQNVKLLVAELEAFEIEHNINKNQLIDMSLFSAWLQKKYPLPNKGMEFFDYSKSESSPPQGSDAAQITQMIVLMYKYLKFYLKKFFENTPLSNPDDFGFLAVLATQGAMQKHDLINRNTMEFSSGIEIIKRLEKHDLIFSSPDDNDKRAKKVEITEKGAAFFWGLIPNMARIGKLALGNLNEGEIDELWKLLHKLNHFHNPIFHEQKTAAIEVILDKYLVLTE